jgi:tripartite-type tricarboxylate transporter receptor subunit TctC
MPLPITNLGTSMKTLRFALLALALPALTGQSLADTFPSKPIRMIAPAPPGGGTDAMARLVATRLTEAAKWTVFVENLPGAGNNIGLRAAAKAAPDGYTLAMGETNNLTVNQYLFKNLTYSPAQDLAPVALIGSMPLVLVVRSDSRFNSLASIVEAGRKGDLFYASSGYGTVGHLVSESLRTTAKLGLKHVPYKGAGPAMTDLLGGQVDLYFASLTVALSHIAAGKLKALAVTSEKRHPALPEVASLGEQGFPALSSTVFLGVVAPAGTPEATLNSLNKEINDAMNTGAAREALAKTGMVPQLVTRAQFAAFLTAERAKWEAVVKATGATVD